jgi:hypothetical protein
LRRQSPLPDDRPAVGMAAIRRGIRGDGKSGLAALARRGVSQSDDLYVVSSRGEGSVKVRETACWT